MIRKSRFKRHKKNLGRVKNAVYSYTSLIAYIHDKFLIINPEYENFSRTTNRHISYVCNELGLESVVSEYFFDLVDSVESV